MSSTCLFAPRGFQENVRRCVALREIGCRGAVMCIQHSARLGQTHLLLGTSLVTLVLDTAIHLYHSTQAPIPARFKLYISHADVCNAARAVNPYHIREEVMANYLSNFSTCSLRLVLRRERVLRYRDISRISLTSRLSTALSCLSEAAPHSPPLLIRSPTRLAAAGSVYECLVLAHWQHY